MRIMDFEGFSKIARERFPFVTEEQLRQFGMLEELYRDWNSRINVISRKDIDELYSHHVLHSLCIAAYMSENGLIPDSRGGSILDLGTGGGFPGIPLAILFPGMHFTLCDSIGKKTRVASEVASALGLHNVSVVNARAESLDGPFDWVVSRAVTALENFLPWVRGKYGKGILYLKGGNICAEISAAMAREGLPKGSITTWPISAWLKDEWFAEKFVIHIRALR